MVLLALPALVPLAGLGVYLQASGALHRPSPAVEPTPVDADPEGLADVEALIRKEFHEGPRKLLKAGKSRLEILADKRRFFDALGEERDFGAEFRPASLDVSGHTLSGEWTVVDGADPDRRLLYLHGGGFTVGSAMSHRPITAALARATGGVVFAPDYRLLPENKRMDGIEDARAAYAWMLGNGPDGESAAREAFVAGDSAGGSLTLMVAQWARDAGLRAPDAIAVFSPSTDYTLRSGSIRDNFEPDTMLQPLFKPFITLSRPLLTAGVWKTSGLRPTDPRNSPLFGKLGGLPPTLIQVSETEMLLDDARNYAARATAHGSEVELEVWRANGADAPLPHVWQIFDRELPAAREAVKRAGVFLVDQTKG